MYAQPNNPNQTIMSNPLVETGEGGWCPHCGKFSDWWYLEKALCSHCNRHDVRFLSVAPSLTKDMRTRNLELIRAQLAAKKAK